jgi:hypothetical protein
MHFAARLPTFALAFRALPALADVLPLRFALPPGRQARAVATARVFSARRRTYYVW